MHVQMVVLVKTHSQSLPEIIRTPILVGKTITVLSRNTPPALAAECIVEIHPIKLIISYLQRLTLILIHT